MVQRSRLGFGSVPQSIMQFGNRRARGVTR